METRDHYLHSSLREGLLEHLFVGEALRGLWLRGYRDFDVLRPITDAAGYDVVLSVAGVIRHIQLKSSFLGAKTSTQKINTALMQQPSGCVIWIWFDPNTLKLCRFGWFGDAPGFALPDLGARRARHTKGDSSGHKSIRDNIRVLAKGRFEVVPDMARLLDRLFEDMTGKQA